ncbi:MAG: type IV pilus assembly protein PilM [Candidatus Spechtbacterales bacterium]|nr:type IV pilus assembly protein PilM [Candidatus Spechtbacterales bacterium]
MIWNPFAKKSYKYKLGIDIGTSSLKVVELLQKGGDIYLNNYAQFYSKANYITARSGSYNILDSQVASILNHLFSKAEFAGREAAMALPVFSSFSTIIDLPAMAEEELENAVRFEARKYIPLPIGEVQFDWAKVDHLSTSDRTKILTVAVPNEIVEKYNRIAELAGIELTNIELETFSAARALVDSDPDPVAILDIGARTTDVSIVDGGTVVMHHNIDSGGSKFIQVIARGMSIDHNRAKELKNRNGIQEASGQVAELIRPSIDKIILEVEQLIEDYVREGGRKVARIILSGGEADMPGLVEYFNSSLGIKAEKGDPFRNIMVPPELEQFLGETGAEFTVAIGLALR